MLAANSYGTHHAPLISLDISSVLEKFKDGTRSAIELFRLNKTLSQLVDLTPYTMIDEKNVEEVDEVLSSIDDTIDVIKEHREGLVNKMVTKRLLSKLLTMQFILSNKLADFELANS